MVDARSKNNEQIVSVNTGSSQTVVQATTNQYMLLDQLAKEHVQNAKEYCELASNSANNAFASAESAEKSYNETQQLVEYITNNAPTIETVETAEGVTITTTDLQGTNTVTLLHGDKGEQGIQGIQGEQGIQGIQGEKGERGADGVNGIDGKDGADGFSPTASVKKVGNTTTLTVIDKNGTTTANILDGAGTVTDVQQNGVSVLKDGIANIITSESSGGYHPPLLQPFWSDHILNRVDLLRADTFSWQSGLIYEAVYNELASEYDNENSVKETYCLSSNVNLVGSLTNNQGVLSGFTTSNYIYHNTTMSFANAVSTSNSWEEVIKFKLNNLGIRHTITGGNSGTYAHDIYINTNNKFTIALSSNGSSYNIATDVVGTFSLSTDTWYWVKLKFTGTQYILSYSINGIDFIDDIVVDSNINIENTTDINYIGCRGGLGYPIDGSIDLNGTYLNIGDTRWWNGTDVVEYKRTPNGYKIADSSQEQAILDKYNTDGIAWYYILDKENVQFKLPRTKFGFEGLRDSVGNDIEAGLPNIIGDITFCSPVAINATENNAFSFGSNNATRLSGSQDKNTTNCIFSAQDSNSTYGNSDTVQERATQMYLYFYVGKFAQDAIEQTAYLKMEMFNSKQDTLIAGENIKIENNVISAIGGGAGLRWEEANIEILSVTLSNVTMANQKNYTYDIDVSEYMPVGNQYEVVLSQTHSSSYLYVQLMPNDSYITSSSDIITNNVTFTENGRTISFQAYVLSTNSTTKYSGTITITLKAYRKLT